jgi:hypothetical protein
MLRSSFSRAKTNEPKPQGLRQGEGVGVQGCGRLVVALLLDQGMRERISNQVLKQVHGRLPFLAKQIMSRKCPMDNACEIEDGAIDD